MRFNVIGHITSDIGLGIMACDLLQALHDLGHDVAGFDVDPGLKRQGRSQRMAPFLRSARQMFRDGIDLAVFPVSVAGPWASICVFGDRRIAYPLWELPDLNSKWAADLGDGFDGVVACSDFIYETLTLSGVNTWLAKHPHYIEPVTADRDKFGLPADRVVFTLAFDPSSDIQRKNPQACIKAFEQAGADNAALCIQINRSVQKFPDLDAWLQGIPRDRVIIVDQHLPHHEAVQLIASSDVYISLHRAEGFGLGMHEAMLCGVPVIATGYSGNLSFMTPANAVLVPYDVVKLHGSIPAYTSAVIGVESKWANPIVESAAYAIATLASEPETRRLLGEAGRAYAEEYQRQARKMEWLNNVPTIHQALARRESLLKSYRAMQSARVLISHDKRLRLREGEVLKLKPEEASELVRGGYLTPCES